jgi:hypothetical protein
VITLLNIDSAETFLLRSHESSEYKAAPRSNIERLNVERPNIERPNIERPNIEFFNVEQPNVERPKVEYGTMSNVKHRMSNVEFYNIGLAKCLISSLVIYDPGPDLFLSGLVLRLKLGLPVGLAGAGGPVRPQAGLTQSGNPNFSTQNGVLVMRVVLTLGGERT